LYSHPKDDRQLACEVKLRPPEASKFTFNIAVILETKKEGLKYWALKHPSERPDFHHPESFVEF